MPQRTERNLRIWSLDADRDDSTKRCAKFCIVLSCFFKTQRAKEETNEAVSYADVLEAMQKHFPAPSQSVLNAWQPAALLDAGDVDEARLLEGPRPGVAEQLLAPPVELQQAVQKHVISVSVLSCCSV